MCRSKKQQSLQACPPVYLGLPYMYKTPQVVKLSMHLRVCTTPTNGKREKGWRGGEGEEGRVAHVS